jgi:hypothetical protein
MRLATTAALLGTALLAGGTHARGTIPSKLKRVLVLDKSQMGASGHFESRRDLNAALASLAVEKGFAVTTIGQNDPASRIAAEFSPEGLAAYQAVIFSSNDGVHAQLNAAEKADFEAYVRNGGGFVPIHAASAFISNWPWITEALVESFYGPTGSNQPTYNLHHDPEGMRDGTETRGIFKGLTTPQAHKDEMYSFRATPRGRDGVTILLTVDEKSSSKPISAPMGEDHPLAWSKAEGKGRIAHISLGHSWSTINPYALNGGYLTKFLYGALRYVAGDFLGCMDGRFAEYNPDATKADGDACKTLVPATMVDAAGQPASALVAKVPGRAMVKVAVETAGRHAVTLLDVTGRSVATRTGVGPADYTLPMPDRSGLHVVLVEAGGRTTRHRVMAL